MPTPLYASITPSRRTFGAIIRVRCFGTGKLKCANPKQYSSGWIV